MPVLVNGTETEAPVEAVTQNGLPVIVPVEIVAATAVTSPERLTVFSISNGELLS